MTTTKTRGRVRVEQGAKRVRIYLAGELVADTAHPRYVWEKPYYPAYYIPVGDVEMEALVDTGEVAHSPSRGDAAVCDVKVNGATAVGAARVYTEGPIDEIANTVAFKFSAFNWFEEDEPIYVHPRDPYTRIDILQSSRHVEVFMEGTKVADTHQPRLLFETGLPTRYYIPATDVRLDLLTHSNLTTDCPYKGTAHYYDATIGGTTIENHIWWYPSPVAESQKIAGYLAFYNEKVDIVVDGVEQERPRTLFS
jgi:uncharacterized protein (DUF427 family)